MIDFLKNNFTWIIGAVFVAIAIFKVVTTFRKAGKIDKEGIETSATVTRIEDVSNAEDATSSYATYVEYMDEYGQLRESFMSLTVSVEHSVGDKVRIKYIPGITDLVREVKD